MSSFSTQHNFMGPLSEITREFSLEDNVYKDMIDVLNNKQIDEFNNLIHTIPYMFPKQIELSSKEICFVEGVEIQFPDFSATVDGKSTSKLLTPHLAKKLGKNYMCNIFVDVRILNTNTGLSTYNKKSVGKFPNMVGANRCLLAHKPAEIPSIEQWLTMLGEDPSIPGGYFIKKGAKKAILYGELLGLDSPTTSFLSKKKIFETRITSLYRSKTYLVRVHSGRRTAGVKIKVPHVKDKHYPLFLVLYLLSRENIGSFNIDLFINRIADMSPIKDRKHVRSYLDTSKTIFFKKFTDTINGKYEKSFQKISDYITKKTGNKGVAPGIDSISALLKSELFPSKEKTVEKIANLLSLVSQHVRCCLNLRPLTNRDSCSVKRYISPTFVIEQDIADNLVSCLKMDLKDNDGWRIGKKESKDSIVESFKFDSINLTMGLLSKINPNVDDKVKIFSIRAVSKTGYGGICPAKTSEGVKCGITKNIAICTRVSWNSEYIPNRLDPIFETLLTPLFSNTTSNELFKFKVVLKDRKTNDAVTIPFFVSSYFLDFVFERKKVEAVWENPFMVILVDFGPSLDLGLWDTTIAKNIPLGNSIDLQELKFYFSIINNFSSTKQVEQYKYTFTYNGNVLLSSNNLPDSLIYPYPVYINPNSSIKKLKTLRRNNNLPIDCCIYRNDVDNIIQYYDNSGRLMCPYLLANDDGDLVFDEKNSGSMWGDFNGIHDYSRSKGKIDELFKTGVLEFVDQKELETTLIAKNINEFRRFANLRKFLRKADIENTESSVYKVNASEYFKNEDTTFVTIDGVNFDVVFTDKEIKTPKIVTINARIEGDIFLKLYGQIIYQSKVFNPVNKKIIEFNKDNYVNCYKRDGFHIFYFDGDQINMVPKGELDIDDYVYKGNKIVYVKFKENTISKIITKVNDEYILEDHTYQKLTNTGDKWVSIENNNIKWSNTRVNSDETYNMVNFDGIPRGESAYFESTNETIYDDLLEDMDYERFDYEKEKKWYDDIVDTDALNHRESDLIVSYIRQDQEHLDDIKINNIDEASSTFNMLKDKFPLFTKRSNIYKLHRYLEWRFKFTHAPIDPNIAYCSVANLVPSAHCNQGPRYPFQCQMITQANGLGNIMHFSSFETSIKKLITPEGHIFETVAEEPLASCTMPTRINFNFAVNTNIENPEDGIVVARSMLPKLRYDRDITITVREKIHKQVEEIIGPPVDYRGNKLIGGIFSHLDENGLPRLGSIINIGDVIVGQRKFDRTTDRIRDISKRAQLGETGEVVQISVISGEESSEERIIRIKLSQRRYLQVGDKMAAPYSQKGTITIFTGDGDTECLDLDNFSFLNEEMKEELNSGKTKFRIVDDHEMPKVIGGVNDGMAIHVIFSPFSFPSRMTLGMNFEMFSSKAALRDQKKVNATTFKNINIKNIEEVLKINGLNKFSLELLAHSDGELMMDSTRGTQMTAYVAPQSNQVLKHNVEDKKSVRGKGPRDSLAQQPVGGRKAQRVGEMERDALLSHGASGLQQERMFYSSDLFEAVVCTSCGNKTSESDVLTGVCKICGKSGSLAINESPRIYSVFNQQLNAIGMNISMKFKDM